ncbi:hypothetical protein J7M00_04890 [bacterium]|nr:hypothetical protein [bacterium]
MEFSSTRVPPALKYRTELSSRSSPIGAKIGGAEYAETNRRKMTAENLR